MELKSEPQKYEERKTRNTGNHYNDGNLDPVYGDTLPIFRIDVDEGVGN